MPTFDEDFTFADIEFFWGKCHEYLQRIYTKVYKEDKAQAWKDEYMKGQNDFRQLEAELPTEETEVAIKAWEVKLWPTYKNMEDDLRNLQWAPEKGAFDEWQKENTNQNQFLADVEMYTCSNTALGRKRKNRWFCFFIFKTPQFFY